MSSRGRVGRLIRFVTPVLIATALVASGCSADDTPNPAPADSAVGESLPGDFSGTAAGALKSASTMPLLDRRLVRITATAARITYLSTSGIDGSTHEVSGSVFVPVGDPPPGGWPVVAYGHGTVGVRHECAPSLSTTLLGSADAVGILLQARYAVVLSDYQGLGLTTSDHPYLDATTAGNNLIDSVLAARQFVPQMSNRWVAVGSSQGGQAAWAANELSVARPAGLKLLGAAAIAPVPDVARYADAASAGTLTADQEAIYPWILYSLKKSYPDLNLDDYRRGVVKTGWDTLTACSGPLAEARLQVAKQIAPADLVPSNPAATQRLRDLMAKMSLPKNKTAAPMLIAFGSKDQLVTAAWTRRAVVRACAWGDSLESYEFPDRGHDDIDGGLAIAWVKGRFSGQPTPNTCRQSVPLPSAQIPTATDPTQE